MPPRALSSPDLLPAAALARAAGAADRVWQDWTRRTLPRRAALLHAVWTWPASPLPWCPQEDIARAAQQIALSLSMARVPGMVSEEGHDLVVDTRVTDGELARAVWRVPGEPMGRTQVRRPTLAHLDPAVALTPAYAALDPTAALLFLGLAGETGHQRVLWTDEAICALVGVVEPDAATRSLRRLAQLGLMTVEDWGDAPQGTARVVSVPQGLFLRPVIRR